MSKENTYKKHGTDACLKLYYSWCYEDLEVKSLKEMQIGLPWSNDAMRIGSLASWDFDTVRPPYSRPLSDSPTVICTIRPETNLPFDFPYQMSLLPDPEWPCHAQNNTFALFIALDIPDGSKATESIKYCIRSLCLVGFSCLLSPNTKQYSYVINPDDTLLWLLWNNECNNTLWCHSIVWHLFEDKCTSECHEIKLSNQLL